MNKYSSDFQSFLTKLDSSQDSDIQYRTAAFNRFQTQGFPTIKNENWRFTNLNPISKTHFRLPDDNHVLINNRIIENNRIKDTILIVVANGNILVESSDLDQLPKEILIRNISELNGFNYIEYDGIHKPSTFNDWNSAFYNRGLYLEITDNCTIKTPLHILYVSTVSAPETVFHYRNSFDLGKNSQAFIVEQYVSSNELNYLNNGVTEININENAALDHIKIQQESSSVIHVQSTIINQTKNSQLRSHQFNLNGQLIRNDIHLHLNGDGGSSMLHGLNLSKDQQHMDTNIVVDHLQPDFVSTQLFKNILNGHSRGVFNGLVIVEKDAQRTNSSQTNKNLLLSKNAIMNSNPQLEIYADDVRCSHGSTTGALEQEALYYIHSRGIDEIQAKILLINGFVSEIIESIAHTQVRGKISDLVDRWLSEEVGIQDG